MFSLLLLNLNVAFYGNKQASPKIPCQTGTTKRSRDPEKGMNGQAIVPKSTVHSTQQHVAEVRRQHSQTKQTKTQSRWPSQRKHAIPIPMHLTCGRARVSTRSLDRIMQHSRLSLQTSPLLARACNVTFAQCLLYIVLND